MILITVAALLIPAAAAFAQISGAENNQQGNNKGTVIEPRQQNQNQTGQQKNYDNVQTHQLTIDSNINGANIYIDGRYMGKTPFTTTVAEGSHEVIVRLPKFENYRETVNITKSTTINAFLARNVANVTIDIPNQFLGSGRSGNITVSIDGERVNDNSVSLQAGEHTVTFSYGGYTVEDNFTVETGKDYTLRPHFSVELVPNS